MTDDDTPYQQLGGDAVFEPLLRDFYFSRLSASSIAHLFPPDRDETFRKQLAFQRMFWGGPDTYTPWRGHPRMRARHLPFPITQAAADVWMGCMQAAVADSAMPADLQPVFIKRLLDVAQAMINQAEADASSPDAQ